MIGGFSLDDADSIRRDMAKKKDISKCADEFLKNAQRNGFSLFDAEELLIKMTNLYAFCFMKAHVVAYALLTCLYLKSIK